MFPNNTDRHISHEAIYNALYLLPRGSLKKELIACLRQGEGKRRPGSYGGGKPAVVSPNHLDHQFEVTAPNVAWVTDITYIRTYEGWLYLAVVIRVRGFSRTLIKQGAAHGRPLLTACEVGRFPRGCLRFAFAIHQARQLPWVAVLERLGQ